MDGPGADVGVPQMFGAFLVTESPSHISKAWKPVASGAKVPVAQLQSQSPAVMAHQ